MRNLQRIAILVLVLILGACSAPGELTIEKAWIRPASAGQNSAAYFVIQNQTASDDTLLNVSSEIAAATEVHMSMADANGVMSMQMQHSVAAPARSAVEFKPGGLHIMFVNLAQDLKAGDTITLTLNFEKAGSLTIPVPVKAP